MACTIQDDMAELVMLLPSEQQGAFAVAVIEYGCKGIEPSIDEPWYPTFFAIKERLTMSREAHENGKKGATKRWKDKRPDKKASIAPYDRGAIDPQDSHAIDLQNGVAVDPYDAENENENENENETESEKKGSMRRNNARKGFSKPSVKDVSAYVQEKGYHVNAERFWNYYESNGWKVGKNPMRSWHSAIATWEQREEVHDAKPNPFAHVQPDVVVVA